MKLSIKVVPDSSPDCTAGWLGEALKIRVKVPAEKGKANKAVEKIIAQALEIPVDNIIIIRGHTSSRKIIEISGLGESEIHEKLESL